MDIESAELGVLPDWLEKGLFDNVLQFGVEFHELSDKNVQAYWDIVTGLYKAGFKLMTFEPNFGAGVTKVKPEEKSKPLFHPWFEVTFRKVDLKC